MTKEIRDKIRLLSAKEIILVMIEGLRNPVVKVDMETYGQIKHFESGKNVCYGCAATNALCKIFDITLPEIKLYVKKDLFHGIKD